MKGNLIPKHAEHSVLLHALVRKRAALAGGVAAHESAIRQINKQITHLDETIGLFNPDIPVDLIRPKRAAPPLAAGYGMMTGTVIRALQDAPAPLTSRDIAYVYVNRFDLDPDDRTIVALISRRVRACLKTLRTQGRVCASPTRDGPQEWMTAHQALQITSRPGEGN